MESNYNKLVLHDYKIAYTVKRQKGFRFSDKQVKLSKLGYLNYIQHTYIHTHYSMSSSIVIAQLSAHNVH